jgi:hypothetical protein
VRIILGVEHCFQDNARNRALRNGGDVDPINLDNMPARHHQQRREKKLMTMDEVNERFPLSKYKNWVAARASEGLSTNGGVAVKAPHSCAASLREPDANPPSSAADAEHPVSSESDGASPVEVTTTEDLGETAGELNSMEATAAEKGAAPPIVEEYHSLKEAQTTDSTVDKHSTPVGGDEDEDEDEDEHIHTAVVPKLLANPGDSCAICIGTLEQDHDIRGLTCGHVFHVGCLDPWLTSRRACCPLCKADYCVPKPCPEGEAVEPERPGQFIFSGYPGDGVNYGPRESRHGMRERRAAAATVANVASPGPASAQQSDSAAPRRWRPRVSNPLRAVHIPAISIPSRARRPDATAEEPTEPSPSQLEAGVVH